MAQQRMADLRTHFHRVAGDAVFPAESHLKKIAEMAERIPSTSLCSSEVQFLSATIKEFDQYFTGEHQEKILKEIVTPEGHGLVLEYLQSLLEMYRVVRNQMLDIRDAKFDQMAATGKIERDHYRRIIKEAQASAKKKNIDEKNLPITINGSPIEDPYIRMLKEFKNDYDRHFLETFNGPILDAIHLIRDTLKTLSARQQHMKPSPQAPVISAPAIK